MRANGFVLLAALGAGCTSVQVAKRDGCWVERRENVFRQVHEEIGPCSRPPPRWSEDRLTRLVQECVADADFRADARAVEAWARRQPAPARPSQEDLLRTCMEEARSAIAAETDLTSLRSRLAQVSTERDALLADLARDRAKLQESHAKLAEWLGKAAQRSPGNAVATSTSTATGTGNGHAGSEGGATLAAHGFGVPLAASTPAPKSSPTLKSAPASSSAPNPSSTPNPGSAPNPNPAPTSTDGSTTTEASRSTATSEPPAAESYIRKPTTSRTIADPSSSRRSTDCSR
jgi:hypothetical protein